MSHHQPFHNTHRVFLHYASGYERIVPVMLVGNGGYTKVEWGHLSSPSFIVKPGHVWVANKPLPRGVVRVTVEAVAYQRNPGHRGGMRRNPEQLSLPLRPRKDKPLTRAQKLQKAFGLTAQKARQVDKAVREARSAKDTDKVFEMLGGAEAIHGMWHSRYYQDIVALYVPVRDTYDLTLLFNTVTGRFEMTSWGDWVERNERRYEIH